MKRSLMILPVLITFLFLIPFVSSSTFVYNNPYIPQIKRDVVTTTGNGDINNYYQNITQYFNVTNITNINQTVISNNSFNQSYTDTLYYSSSNPNGYISSVTLDQVLNPVTTKNFNVGGNNIIWTFTNPSGAMIWNLTGGWNGHILEVLDSSSVPSGSAGDHLLHIYSNRANVVSAHFKQATSNTALLVDDGIVNFQNATYISGNGSRLYQVNYTETDPKFLQENNSLWIEARIKYNATYDSSLQFCYNHSLVLINQYGDTWSSTSNESYLLRGTNDTINIKYQNISNIPSCTSGQFLTNTSGLACDTPVITSNEQMLLFTTDRVTTNITGWWINISFNASASSRYLFDCDIITNASANTIGLVVNLSTNTTPSNYIGVLSTYSSATAIVSLSSIVLGVALVGTGQAGASPHMNSELHGTLNTAVGGTVFFHFRPDQAGTLQINKGSYCEITKTL